MIRRTLIILNVSLAWPVQAQSPMPTAADSARRVVQAFYDWYVPRAAEPGARDMVMAAATTGPLRFQPELVRWLRIDSTARARATDEVDGLDGDPYLNAQDPCDRYTVQSVRTSGRTVTVAVLGAGRCAHHTAPDVVVELTRDRDRWTVTEFRDPHRGNAGLIPLLKRLHPMTR